MKRYYSKYRSSSLSGKNLFRRNHIETLFKQFSVNFGKHLPSSKSAAIVDIGCGAGELVGWLQSRGFTNVYGYDISQEQINEAKHSFFGEFFCADVLNDDFNFPMADVFFLRDVLEHFNTDQIDKIFIKLRSRLNPDGQIIIQTVNASAHSGLITFYSDITHQTCFTERSLSQIIRINLGVTPVFFPWYRLGKSWVSIIALYLSRVLGLVRYILTSIEIGSGNKIFTPNLIAVIHIGGKEDD